jgi:large subunit ribosomal protein L24
MKIKVGDNVRVITGSNKGKEGKVLKVLRTENKVLVDGVNIIKKHVKPNRENETGGILEVEAPLHISNVKVVSKETKKEDKAKAKEAKTKEVAAKKETKTSKKKEEESK